MAVSNRSLLLLAALMGAVTVCLSMKTVAQKEVAGMPEESADKLRPLPEGKNDRAVIQGERGPSSRSCSMRTYGRYVKLTFSPYLYCDARVTATYCRGGCHSSTWVFPFVQLNNGLPTLGQKAYEYCSCCKPRSPSQKKFKFTCRVSVNGQVLFTFPQYYPFTVYGGCHCLRCGNPTEKVTESYRPEMPALPGAVQRRISIPDVREPAVGPVRGVPGRVPTRGEA